MDNVTAATPSQTILGGTSSPELTGRTLGEFHILRKLGQGGMGQVYLAEQLSLKRKVALKILRSDIATNSTALQRFKVEAEAVARATHANIVQVYVIGEAEGLHYMALEYVEGRNLRDFIVKKGPPEVLLALSIMRQVAAALQRAAELGIIHRDIKPENILLTRKGEVKVADFGLSRSLTGDQVPLNITQSGVVMGTPLYMSPEQVEGKPVDARTDIYSLGVTCYHMMAGHPPFEGNGVFDVALKHVREEPTPLADIRPDLPDAFCAVIHRMMAKNPDQRYQACRELLRDLSVVREGLGGVSGSMTRTEVSVELVPLPGGSLPEVTIGAGSASGSALTPSSTSRVALQNQPLPARRPAWVWGIAALTVPVALGGGLALASWLHSGSNLWTASVTKPNAGNAVLPQDAQEVDAIVFADSPLKREKALREAIELYLNPASGIKDPQGCLLLSINLSVFYFEQDRLDDAEKFFARLEGTQERRCTTLGRFGRAMVLALRSQPAESNKVFQEVFSTKPFNELPARPGVGSPGRPRANEPEFVIWYKPEFRFWIAQALYYNEKNGLAKKEWPERLRDFRDTLPKTPGG
jgi:eukaryotic-like serine/threonine-protein kinase